MDQSGNVKIKNGVLYGNERFTGSVRVPVGQQRIRVERQWDAVPSSVAIVPSYDTRFWIDELSMDGFYIELSEAPKEDAVIYWSIMFSTEEGVMR